MSFGRWKDREDVVYLHVDYYAAIDTDEILPFAKTQMELEAVRLSEVSQSEKDSYHTTLLIRGVRETRQSSRGEGTEKQNKTKSGGDKP